ncbi:MAG: homocysteine S-methyltransferase family protein [Bacteroidales bacterium]|nr:homocysteine S-methyltransferase family protein [Bacteroidales bacterium]
MTRFEELFKNSKFILTEGGMVERVRREAPELFDPHIAHAGLVYSAKGREILENIYREYIDIACKYNLKMLSLAPTWRANPERIKQSVFRNQKNIINQECIGFLKSIRDKYGDFKDSIFIGGMMACKNDAYKAEEALSIEESKNFHTTQAVQLAESGVDFIKAATLPALSEALGIAATISELKVPYVLSFVVRPDGKILDGTSLHQVIDQIDSEVPNPPAFYMINCVHPTIFDQAIKTEWKNLGKRQNRILGLQANTSAKTPEELESLPYLDTTEPENFADQMINIHNSYGVKLIGGCCGSDNKHIEAIARRIAAE